MRRVISLESHWEDAPPSREIFRAEDLAHLPSGVRRYLCRAIPRGSPLFSAVCLRMLGEIKLARWQPFRAE